jgi:hypothetical protein
MHWRTPFPPKRLSVLAELLAVVRSALHPEQVMTGKPAELPDELPDELPPTVVADETSAIP